MLRRGATPEVNVTSTRGLKDVFEQCRVLGMRLSRQRRMVLDLLWTEKSHLSARDIFEKLNSRGRSIGNTSVYQNLEALQSAGAAAPTCLGNNIGGGLTLAPCWYIQVG